MHCSETIWCFLKVSQVLAALLITDLRPAEPQVRAEPLHDGRRGRGALLLLLIIISPQHSGVHFTTLVWLWSHSRVLVLSSAMK